MCDGGCGGGELRSDYDAPYIVSLQYQLREEGRGLAQGEESGCFLGRRRRKKRETRGG